MPSTAYDALNRDAKRSKARSFVPAQMSNKLQGSPHVETPLISKSQGATGEGSERLACSPAPPATVLLNITWSTLHYSVQIQYCTPYQPMGGSSRAQADLFAAAAAYFVAT